MPNFPKHIEDDNVIIGINLSNLVINTLFY